MATIVVHYQRLFISEFALESRKNPVFLGPKLNQCLAWFLFQSVSAGLTAAIIALHYSEACDLVSDRVL